MRARNANSPRLVIHLNVHGAVFDDGVEQLGCLITFRKIWVKIVFPVKGRACIDLGANGHAEHGGVFKCLGIGDRQDARQSQINGIGLRIRGLTKGG